jgi:hypothetical protein
LRPALCSEVAPENTKVIPEAIGDSRLAAVNDHAARNSSEIAAREACTRRSSARQLVASTKRVRAPLGARLNKICSRERFLLDKEDIWFPAWRVSAQALKPVLPESRKRSSASGNTV